MDNFYREEHIDHIDFLKMDTEENELNALKGVSQLISRGAIDFVQFEFGGANMDNRVFFRDFWLMLHEDFYFYREMKDGLVEITPYSEALEQFSTTNILLERKR